MQEWLNCLKVHQLASCSRVVPKSHTGFNEVALIPIVWVCVPEGIKLHTQEEGAMVYICLVVWQGQGSHGPPPRAAPHAAKTSALPVCRCSLQDVLVFVLFFVVVFFKEKADKFFTYWKIICLLCIIFMEFFYFMLFIYRFCSSSSVAKHWLKQNRSVMTVTARREKSLQTIASG